MGRPRRVEKKYKIQTLGTERSENIKTLYKINVIIIIIIIIIKIIIIIIITEAIICRVNFYNVNKCPCSGLHPKPAGQRCRQIVLIRGGPWMYRYTWFQF